LRKKLSQKLGEPDPKTGMKLRPILIADLGDKSHCGEGYISNRNVTKIHSFKCVGAETWQWSHITSAQA